MSVPALFLVLSAALGVTVAARVNWWTLRSTGLLLWIPIVALVGIEVFSEKPLLSGWGWLAWPGAIAVHYYLLAGLERRTARETGPSFLVRAYHAIGLWLVAWLGTVELLSWTYGWETAGEIWVAMAWAAMPLLLILGVTLAGARLAWPLHAHYPLYMRFALAPLILYLAGWTLVLNLTANGDAAPLAYIPILNPFGVTQILIFAALFLWLNRLQEMGMHRQLGTAARVVGLGLVIFGSSGELARLGHQWWGIDFTPAALLDSALLQAAYSILWTVLATIFMFWGTWRVRRWLWLMGAALLGLTILKLFVVDLSGAETLARIVSFIGVGLLMLLIGYFAPIPPASRPAPLVAAGELDEVASAAESGS